MAKTRNEIINPKTGKRVSKKDFESIQKIKSTLPKQVRWQKVANAFINDKIDAYKETSRPVHSVYKNVKDFKKRNPNLKIGIKDREGGELKYYSELAAEIKIEQLNKELWRDFEDLYDEDEEIDTDKIPNMQVTVIKKARSHIPKEIILDFSKIEVKRSDEKGTFKRKNKLDNGTVSKSGNKKIPTRKKRK